MATLKAHGQLLGKITFVTYTLAYMSDGEILRKIGNGGWKRYKQVKPGIDPSLHYTGLVARFEQRLKDFPHWAEYRRTLHKFVTVANRPRVHQTLQMLSNDVDGVWSELNDSYRSVDLDLDDVKELCDKFTAAADESKLAKLAKTEVASN